MLIGHQILRGEYTLVSRRIRPSNNCTDVTFPLALVVACAIHGIQLNVVLRSSLSGRFFIRAVKRQFFFPV